MTHHENQEADELVGQVVDGRFELVRVLGAGAMGKIYLARQLSLDLMRAVKIIGGIADQDGSAERRFRREALAMSRLQHDKITQIIDFGTLGEGKNYLVMEYIEGEDLQQKLDRERYLRLRPAVEVLIQIAQAVSYAHEKGIVHRDLKPANVLLSSGDVSQVKVIDFGLAKLLTDEGLTKLTANQQLLGTPIFMSPEQCLCAPVGAPADVYAMAGIAYYCISGKPVFLERTVTSMIVAQTYHQAVPLSERCTGLVIPPALDQLLLDCLKKEPTARPTAREFLTALREVHPAVSMKYPSLPKMMQFSLPPGGAPVVGPPAAVPYTTPAPQVSPAPAPQAPPAPAPTLSHAFGPPSSGTVAHVSVLLTTRPSKYEVNLFSSWTTAM